MQNIVNKVLKFYRLKSVKNSLPVLVLVVGGSFGLNQFMTVRYEYSKKKFITPEEAEKYYGVKMKKSSEVTLETEFDKIKEIDIENWEQVRIPRPWEEKSN